jgi:CIC family chloride channel protein
MHTFCFYICDMMKVWKYLNRIITNKTGNFDQRSFIYFLSFIVGLLSAVAAAILKNAVYNFHEVLTSGISTKSGNYLYIVYPLAGMVLTVIFVKFVVKDNISHGISRILYAISRKRSSIRAHNTWTSIVASTLTIGFGGSVGAEAPIVLTGASIGSRVGKLFKLNYRNITLLIGCGAAGAVSGIFKAPVAGIVFTLEILMLDLTISSIVPLLISSVTAATVAYFLIGDKVLFSFILTEPFILSNIPWYIVLGAFSGLISLYFSKMTTLLENQYERIKSIYVRLLTGGLIVGILIYMLPPLFGEGYDTIKILLNGDTSTIMQNSFFSQFNNSYATIALFMGALILLKVIASSSTNGAGGVGGVFAPTLFIGGLNGFFVATLLNRYIGTSIPENKFALVGMAGLMAGVMHAPLTAIFLVAEITGGYGLLIPLIITSTISYITIKLFESHSLYHRQLAHRGELITHDKDKAVMIMMDWKKEIETDLLTVKSSEMLGDLVKVISHSRRNIFPVVDENNILEGVVVLDDIREIMFEPEKYEETYIKDLMTIPPSYIDIKEKMETVMDTFRKTGAWNLPVLDNGLYVGFISKSRIFAAYRDLLVQFSEE